MRRCSGCGLLFNSPRLDGEGLARLYGGSYYFFNRGIEQEFFRILAMYQRTVALIEHKLLERRALDLGCGRGFFPALLRASGWDAHGVELSGEAADEASRVLGVPVFKGTIEEFAANRPGEPFPLVTAIDVIEHVPDPAGFIGGCARVTKAGGYLILDTPNSDAGNIESIGLEWRGFNPFHIYLFNARNLAQLVESHGFTVERVFSYNNNRMRRSLSDRLRGVLRRTGLLGAASRAYFWFKGARSDSADPAQALSRAVGRLAGLLPWDQTADARDELAAGNRGDNIILIARKQG